MVNTKFGQDYRIVKQSVYLYLYLEKSKKTDLHGKLCIVVIKAS